MDLHLHLTFAFRALDHKWGQPVDLETVEDCSTSSPALVDQSFTTFSSEEYLRTMRRQRRERPCPYPRRRRDLADDSLTNISVHRIASVSDLGGSISLLSTSAFSDTSTASDLSRAVSDRGFVDAVDDHTVVLDEQNDVKLRNTVTTLDSRVQKKKKLPDGILGKLKKIAFTLVDAKHASRRKV